MSPKYGSPVLAHLLDLVVAAILIGGATYLAGTFFALFGAILAAMVYFVFIGLAAATHAFRHEHGTSKFLLGLAGITSAIVFGGIAYQFLTNPTLSIFAEPSPWFNEAYLVITLVAGAVIYLVSKSYHKKRGMDISLNYKELPPE